MRTKSIWRPEHSVTWAYASNLCLGVGMIVWGLAPLVLQQTLSREPTGAPETSALFRAGLFGLTFVGLSILIRRRVRWAICAAFLVAVAMALVGITANATSEVTSGTMFLSVLSSVAAVSSWLALDAVSRLSAADAVVSPRKSPVPHKTIFIPGSLARTRTNHDAGL